MCNRLLTSTNYCLEIRPGDGLDKLKMKPLFHKFKKRSLFHVFLALPLLLALLDSVTQLSSQFFSAGLGWSVIR